MARTDAQRERQQQRKLERLEATTHGGYAGQSILEMLIDKLDHAMDCYLEAKDKADTKQMQLCRGEVRGLARAIALMENPYQPTRGIKQAETDSASRVRRARHAAE